MVEIVISATVTAWAGPAFVRWAVREERGQIYCAPEVLEITNRITTIAGAAFGGAEGGAVENARFAG